MADKKKGGQDSKKGRPRSAGKSKGKIANYFGSGRLARKKIRRMLRANGTREAKNYAEKTDQMNFFRGLEDSGLVGRIEMASMRRRNAVFTRKEARQSQRHCSTA